MADEGARFFDTRAAYTMFVNATDEKSVVADRIGRELALVDVHHPGLRVFDAGMGDGALLTHLMRRMHERLPFIPWLIVAKEISIEDVRQALAKLPDRFLEHPEMVFVVTNLNFGEAPSLSAPGLVWRHVPLQGSTTWEFADQIEGLYPRLATDWQVKTSEITGNPLYVQPSALVLHRRDRQFLLESLIPGPGGAPPRYDLVIASQAYRARTAVERKVRTVLVPLAASLAPGGRLVGVQARGNDPGLEIIRGVWPEEEPFRHRRSDILAEARRQLGGIHDLDFPHLTDEESLFQFSLHTMPSVEAEHIGTSSVVAAWNAATYVAQIDELRLSAAMAAGGYLDATRQVMEQHGRIWWNDEAFLITRRKGSRDPGDVQSASSG
ncbi:MAG: hypothetical protein Q8Q52_02890 [Acidimicrobiia bacterium]|nr:hypothetical protein [Acidimicrobiia bacterium]